MAGSCVVERLRRASLAVAEAVAVISGRRAARTDRPPSPSTSPVLPSSPLALPTAAPPPRAGATGSAAMRRMKRLPTVPAFRRGAGAGGAPTLAGAGAAVEALGAGWHEAQGIVGSTPGGGCAAADTGATGASQACDPAPASEAAEAGHAAAASTAVCGREAASPTARASTALGSVDRSVCCEAPAATSSGAAPSTGARFVAAGRDGISVGGEGRAPSEPAAAARRVLSALASRSLRRSAAANRSAALGWRAANASAAAMLSAPSEIPVGARPAVQEG
mmetsp:Transcript_902/g.2990  ORF Transcript_902/g.2990 Transcript_902/m.2990 type:complete len:278 (-) Transcript_902:1262-2095(-)|eukprot:scaffold1644_cov89-Isochrysis_galbana.AAC.3